MQSVELVGRLLLSLLAVLAVVWLLGRKLRKGGRLKDSKLIDVLGRQQLNRSASLAVVRVGDRALIIGVTDAQVNVLGETDLASAQAAVTSSRTLSVDAVTSHRRAPGRRTGAAALGQAALGQAALGQAALGQAALPQQALGQPLPTQPPPAVEVAAPRSTGPFSGSALSPQTWRQTIESLRDLTSR